MGWWFGEQAEEGWLLSGLGLMLMVGCGALADGVMVVGVERCGWSVGGGRWAVVTGDELTTSRGDDVYLTFLECRGKGGASAAKSQRGTELREGTERGCVRNHGRGLRCAETRRAWLCCSANWPFPFAPRTRGTGRGAPDEQSRPGPWKPGAGGSHSPAFPWPHSRIPALPLARTCPPPEIWCGFDTPTEPAPPNALPCRALGCSLGLASGSEAAIEKRRPDGLLNGFMSPVGQFSRPCHSPTPSDRLLRAPRRRRRQRPRASCGGTARRQRHPRERHPRGTCHVALGPLPLSQTQTQRKKVVGDDG